MSTMKSNNVNNIEIENDHSQNNNDQQSDLSLQNALNTLSDDVEALWCRPIAVLDSPPDPLTFVRDFVAPNVPCIIRNAITANSTTDGAERRSADKFTDGDRSATPLRLTLDDIIDRIGEEVELTVDVTPDGHGDCIRTVARENQNQNQNEALIQKMFVKPHEERMTIGNFRKLLRRQTNNDTDELSNFHARSERHQNNQQEGNGCGGETDNSADRHVLHIFQLCNPSDTERKDNMREEQKQKYSPVVYYSRQNDCLRTELQSLFSNGCLFPPTLKFAEEAFGTGPPDAINLWIGNQKSVSSMHKDHYENLFYVCSGEKEFVLCPPSDVVFLYEGEFVSGTFCPLGGEGGVDGGKGVGSCGETSWVVLPDESGDEGGENLDSRVTMEVKTKWIEPDIKKCLTQPGLEEFPLLKKAHPVKVLVSEGEMLYIPSLWFHRVTQTKETVGVNYWFDMKFDSPLWCYFNFLQQFKAPDRKDTRNW